MASSVPREVLEQLLIPSTATLTTALKKQGLNNTFMHGVEPMGEAATYATTTLDLDVINALFEDGLFAPATFDFIVLDQVLEHVPKPTTMLRDVFRALKPSGVLFLAVPPIDWTRRAVSASLQFPMGAVEVIDKRFGKLASLVKGHDMFRCPEGHISYFSTTAIGVLATRCDARVLAQYHAQRFRPRWWSTLGLSTGSFFLQRDGA